MARLTDRETHDKYLQALSEWNVGNGGIRWAPLASNWLYTNLSGISQREVGRLMYEHVKSGGKIDQVLERRPEWRRLQKYHYDLIVMIDGCLRYIETCLDYRIPFVPDEPWILVVNIHAR